MPWVSVGEVVADRFRIEREVAAGGMGRIFRALDRSSGAPVALKVMLTSGGTEGERFLREAAALEAIEHPGVVRHVAHGIAASGEPYIAMQWLDGINLKTRLEQGRLSIEETLALGRRVADALAAVHARGIVHRDIKPSNLMLIDAELEQVRIVDFGVARRNDEVQRLTRTGQVLGTPCYMAPEQARGARDLDPSVDVFALGALLYECIVGQPPFWGDTLIEVLAKVLFEPAPPLSDAGVAAHPAVEALLSALLEKDRTRRPGTGAAVVARIDALAAARSSKQPGARAPIGSAEQRVLCLLLVGDPAGTDIDPIAPTLQPLNRTLLTHRLGDHPAAAGARIEELLDGSMMVQLAGTGVASDQAARAGELALLARDLAPGARIAIATGRAEQGRTLPVGDAARRATKLLASAADGRIRIDRATARLAGARFVVEDEGDDHVLVGAKADPALAGAPLLLGKATRCVGRSRELELLSSLFEEAAADSEARAAIVLAAAGVGKSRLRREISARVSERHPELVLLFGQGEVHGAGAPFGLIGQAIRRRAQIAIGDPAPVKTDKLAAMLGGDLSGGSLERARVFLGEAARVPAAEDESDALRAARRDPSLMGDAIRSAWRDWIEALCQRAPVLIVFDDLHWGDLPSVELADFALRTLGRSPLMVLGLARPEVAEKFPDLWAIREPLTVRLAPLGRRAAEELVKEVLGDNVGEATLSWIINGAAGNAFYLEELIRAAAESRSETSRLNLPDTVLGLLQARLDAFGDEAKRVLRAASVFGETFWSGGLTALIGPDVDRDAALRELSGRELVEAAPGTRFPGHAELVFRHALVRDAAYAMLPERDRQVAHERAAEWLESVGERDASVLAEHYAKSERTERAGPFFLQAAIDALEGNDLDEAIARAERGKSLATGAGVVGELGLVRSRALASRGEHVAAESAAFAAAELLPRGGAPWFSAMGEAVAAAARLGQLDRLLASSRTLIECEAAPEALTAQVVGICRTIVPLTNVLDLDLADAALARLAQIAPRPELLDAYAEGQLHEARGLVPGVRGRLGAIALGFERAAACYEAAAAARDVITTLGSLGWALYCVGQLDDARNALERGLALAQRTGAPQPRVWVEFQLGLVTAELDPERGTELLERSVELYERQSSRRQEGWARTELARALLARGEIAQAERMAARGAELLSSGPVFLPRALSVRASALARLGDAGQALEVASAARQLQDRHAYYMFDGCVRTALVEALHAAGDQSAFRSELAAARRALAMRTAELERPEWRQAFARIREHARLSELD